MAKKGPFPEPMEKREKNCEFPPCHQEEPSLFTSDTSAEGKLTECYARKCKTRYVNNALIILFREPF